MRTLWGIDAGLAITERNEVNGEQIQEWALEEGFDAVGLAAAVPSPRASSLMDWIGAGHHADMAWFERDPERRTDPGLVLPGAQSVIVLGMSYYVDDPPAELWEDPMRGRVARYAWGRDYHKVIEPKLKRLVARLDAAVPEAQRGSRGYVDHGPLLERDLAERAGLGFIGKNTLLITKNYASYLFLSAIVTRAEIEPDVNLDGSGFDGTCGNCRRCLDVCPTYAFPAEYVLDSRKCISYLTIEHRGVIEAELAGNMGNWIFGCDLCQSVCPYVKRYREPAEDHWLRFDPEHAAPYLPDMLGLDDAAFLARYAGTPLMRPKRRGLLRNAVIALGNSGSDEAVPVLRRALEDSEPLVREQAALALRRLEER